MISHVDLKKAVEQAQPLFQDLQALYRNVPDTHCRCEQPGICCSFIPEITFIESLQWLQVIYNASGQKRSRWLQQFVAFYLTNPIRHMGCPFLVNGVCAVYEYRAFACRAYGLWSRMTGNARTKQNREAKKALLTAWERFGLELPAEAVAAEIDYCDKVECLSPENPSDAKLMKILQQIYALDQSMPDLQLSFETEYHSDFSFLIASLALGYRKVVLGKYAVIKEIVRQGTDGRLQQMLDKVSGAVWQS
jgi:Fe-S-cluster containining protein